MTALLKETDFLEVELPNIEYSPDELSAIKDIQSILELSGLDSRIQIGLPKAR
jgi:hypothetical protein